MSTNMNQQASYPYVDGSSISHIPNSTKKSESQVNNSCVALEFALQELHKTCAEMEQRLKPLLRNEPEAAGSDKQEAVTLVPLAAQIEGYVREVKVAINTGQSILRRLEL